MIELFGIFSYIETGFTILNHILGFSKQSCSINIFIMPMFQVLSATKNVKATFHIVRQMGVHVGHCDWNHASASDLIYRDFQDYRTKIIVTFQFTDLYKFPKLWNKI